MRWRWRTGQGSERGIPVTAGVHTETANVMTQRKYAERFPAQEHADGVAALLNAIRKYPGKVTLLAIGPLFNVGAAIDRDPETFRKNRPDFTLPRTAIADQNNIHTASFSITTRRMTSTGASTPVKCLNCRTA